MPNPKDFLPPPPWEGPPVPKIVTDSKRSESAMDWYLATGRYLWKGVEYPTPPYELEVDVGRGVIYLHSLFSGQTILRVCRVPDDVIRMFKDYTVVIDLVRTPARHGGGGSRTVKASPAFLDIPKIEQLLVGIFPDTGSFSINDKAGRTYFLFRNVPRRLLKDLSLGIFTDITLGITGR